MAAWRSDKICSHIWLLLVAKLHGVQNTLSPLSFPGVMLVPILYLCADVSVKWYYSGVSWFCKLFTLSHLKPPPTFQEREAVCVIQ